MKIVGTTNHNCILIIAKPELFSLALSTIIDEYDKNIISGILNFLDIDENSSITGVIEQISSQTKPIFFFKSLSNTTRKSYIIYVNIIEKVMSDIKCNIDKFTNDDYSVIAPYSVSGSYISNNFSSI